MRPKSGYEKISDSESKKGDTNCQSEFGSSHQEPNNGKLDDDLPDNISFFELFKYATCGDKLLAITGAVFAIIEGSGLSLMSIVFGNMSNILVRALRYGLINEENRRLDTGFVTDNGTQASGGEQALGNTFQSDPYLSPQSPLGVPRLNESPVLTSDFEAQMAIFAFFYFGIGLAVYISSAIQIWCLNLSSERQIYRIKQKFFANILRQELHWFDKNQSGELASKLNDDVERIRDGLGDQLSLCIKQMASFFSGFTVGFIVSWRLTLVMTLATPLLSLFSAYIGKILASSSKREQQKYAEAGGFAQEILVAIRTVFSLNGQKFSLKTYNKKLQDGRIMSIKKYVKLSVMVAVSLLVLYCTYALALYVATLLIGSDLMTPGSAMTVLMSVMMAAGALGNIIPPLMTVTTALSSASLIYSIIDSVPTIDASSERGLKLAKVTANIKFDDVTFCYPLRPSIPVVKNFTVEFKQGQTVAICGKTGAGKSTIINLLLRFYDPNYGSIYLDNCDFTELDVAWLRSLIGIVEQEPALFDCSISENIALGATNEFDRIQERIIAASKLANAHEFIKYLPEGYNTRCGDRGYQMSGGQKQRVAIARALLSDPRILILDEATSALDSGSESVVQEALNKARKGRTTIIIAHRLSTIRDADSIVVMDGGKMVESGKHDELMAAKGFYFNLVTNQVFDEPETPDKTADLNDDYDSDEAEAKSSLHGSGVLDRQRKFSSLLYDSISRPPSTKAITETEEEKISAADIFFMVRGEFFWLSTGIIMSSVTGLLQPIFGLFYAQIFNTLSLRGERLYSEGRFWSLMFVVYAVLTMVSMFLRIFLIAVGIENNTARLRSECFEQIIRQQVGWFDVEDNTPQRLTARLASDVPQIKAVINSRLGVFVSGATTIITALAIAFAISWKMALLLTVLLPLLLEVGFIQMRMTRRDNSAHLRSMEDSSRLATEAVEHVKLIQAIGQEKYFCSKFVNYLEEPYRNSLIKHRKFAFVYGISQSAIYFVYGLSFWFGGYLVANDGLSAVDMFRVFFAIAFTAVAVGQWGGMGGDMSRINQALSNIKRLLTLQPVIDNLSAGGIKPRFKGHVTFTNVHFRYPTRSDNHILQGISLSVKPGQTVALVGASGCGKSTIAALMLRFYDPDMGVVKLDNYDLRCINLEHLRRNVCIVSQEPVLFKASIKENILYGLDPSSYSMRDVREAAITANIDDFILSLPLGYDTQVGERGTQMSGGQKQRIAIARAIVRNPKVLILDEATSALDSESEALVSQALEKASKGKTCVKIAHRLSTVRDSDLIAVVDRGSVVELGSHDELMALGKRGFYARLMEKQEITS